MAWTLTREDGIAILVLDLPGKSANTLGSAVLEELAQQLTALEREPPRGLILRSGKSSGFIAGADINEFTRFRSVEEALTGVRRGQVVLDRLDALPCPTVALLHGFALGGGLELALACDYRVGIDDGHLALGLPEVQLGIHPGFGGTVRSVRLLGVRAAMDLMLTGKTVRAERALKIGLIDRLVTAEQGETECRALIASRPAVHSPSLLDRALSWPGIRRFVYPALRRQVSARVREAHYPAPFAIVSLWRKFGASGREAYDAEARSIAELFLTPTSRNLVRVFQLQDRLKSLGGRDRTGSTAPIRHVHVVGAGVMGGDIAAWCALRGFEVTLQDRSTEQIAPALTRAEELFRKRAKGDVERQQAMNRLVADVDGAGVSRADLALEAIFEDLEAKQSLYARLEPTLPANALLATNTSSIPLESLDAKLQRPAD